MRSELKTATLDELEDVALNAHLLADRRWATEILIQRLRESVPLLERVVNLAYYYGPSADPVAREVLKLVKGGEP